MSYPGNFDAPYWMPVPLTGNTVRGSYRQPLGPYAPLSYSGYGQDGIAVGTLGNRALADQTGIALALNAIPTNSADLWYFDDPMVMAIAHEPGQQSRMHSSTYGIASSDGTNTAYSGMGRDVPSYGFYGNRDYRGLN